MKSNYGAADRSFMRGKGPSHCLPERKRVPTILLCEVFIMQAQRRPRGGGNYMASRSLWSKLKGFMITLQLISYSCSWTCLGDVLPPVLKWQLQPEMTMHKGKDFVHWRPPFIRHWTTEAERAVFCLFSFPTSDSDQLNAQYGNKRIL